MKKLVLVLLLMVTHSTLLAQSTKAAKEWRKIEETSIEFKNETGQILVTSTKRYGAIKIKVDNAAINFEFFDIYFDDGSLQRVDIHQVIKSGGETNAMIIGGKKIIKRIDFSYKSIGITSSTKPQVELWGI